jgi:hypothetical protein
LIRLRNSLTGERGRLKVKMCLTKKQDRKRMLFKAEEASTFF